MSVRHSLFIVATVTGVILLLQSTLNVEAGNSEARKQMEAQSKAIASGVKANAHVGTQTVEVKKQLDTSTKQQTITDAECKRKFGPQFQAGVGKRLCINHINGESYSWAGGNKPVSNPNGGKQSSVGTKPTYGCFDIKSCQEQSKSATNKKSQSGDVSLKGKAWKQLKDIGRTGSWGGN